MRAPTCLLVVMDTILFLVASVLSVDMAAKNVKSTKEDYYKDLPGPGPLLVKRLDFQSGKRGSIPRRGAMNVVDRAQAFALQHHFGVVNKHDGEPYVLHLHRVEMGVRNMLPGGVDQVDFLNNCRAVAWLHDVVEDTEVTLLDLKNAGFDDEIIDAVDAMSKRQGETNEAYYHRVKRNKIAAVVKLCDLHDNFGRNHLIEGDDEKRLRMAAKYSLGIDILSRVHV